LLQLQSASADRALRVTSTVDALDAISAGNLLEPDKASALREAWELATRARNGIFLVRGRPSDQLPRPGAELTGVARACGYGPDDEPGLFLEDYRRTTRRARTVVEQVFYGLPAAGAGPVT
jgi:glutamate-ammonia-ligase adenylyltransferase